MSLSVFTSRVTSTLLVPGAPEQSVTIRKLAPKHLDAAQRRSQQSSMAALREMGGSEFLRELQSLTATSEKDAAPVVEADPLSGYDRVALIVSGVKSWTFTDDDGKTVEVTDATVSDMDGEIQDWLAREILRLSRPVVFQSAEQRAAAQKNG